MRLLNALMNATYILVGMLVVIGIFLAILVLLKKILPEKYGSLPYWIWIAFILLWAMTLGFYLNL